MRHRKIQQLRAEQQQVLRSQAITPDGPGTVVHDFDVLLRFLGMSGVVTAGELRLLPIKALPELNAAMRDPLRVDLQRGQLKSYPNLAALLMLARASGIVMLQQGEGNGEETRLALDGELQRQWIDLNPVERYCTLLEVWALHAKRDVLGERGGWGSLFARAVSIWERVPKNGRKYSNDRRASAEGYKDLDYDRYNLAFLWLFGLLEVEQGAALPKKGWCPAVVRHTPFGDALLTLLANSNLPLFDGGGFFDLILWNAAESEQEPEPEAEPSGNSPNAEPAGRAGADEQEADADETGAVSLDELQPILKPYFPQWERALTIPPPEYREGVYIFKTVLKGSKVLRRFAVPDESTWDDFGNAIRRSVNFDDEHLWAFTWTDRFGSKLQINRDDAPDMGFDEDSISGAEYEIGGTPLRIGEPFPFVYDFGESWTFEVVLERIDPPDPTLTSPKLIEKKGRSPKQYAGSDWD